MGRYVYIYRLSLEEGLVGGNDDMGWDGDDRGDAIMATVTTTKLAWKQSRGIRSGRVLFPSSILKRRLRVLFFAGAGILIIQVSCSGLGWS